MTFPCHGIELLRRATAIHQDEASWGQVAPTRIKGHMDGTLSGK